MIWVVLLTLGTILPAEWLDEKFNLVMPENYGQLFDSVMKNPWGYIAIGIFAPLAEEMVFRGGVLRVLLQLFHQKWHWGAIALSALVFAFMHGNVAQGLHAFAIGLLLGWMYYRTDSIIPGVILHWVNNTVAYFMFNLMPWMEDGKLIDLFHGNARLMTGGIVFSFCILIPSIYQLYMRMKKA
jgi:membrane protease YdiL (CAAX protease family)